MDAWFAAARRMWVGVSQVRGCGMHTSPRQGRRMSCWSRVCLHMKAVAWRACRYTLAVTIPGDPEDPGPGTTIRVHLAGSVMGEGKGTPQLRGNVRLVGHSQQCDSDSTMVE